MTKTDKELTVDIVKAVLESNTAQLAIDSRDVPHQTKRVTLQEINTIIQSVHSTLQDLPEKK